MHLLFQVERFHDAKQNFSAHYQRDIHWIHEKTTAPNNLLWDAIWSCSFNNDSLAPKKSFIRTKHFQAQGMSKYMAKKIQDMLTMQDLETVSPIFDYTFRRKNYSHFPNEQYSRRIHQIGAAADAIRVEQAKTFAEYDNFEKAQKDAVRRYQIKALESAGKSDLIPFI